MQKSGEFMKAAVVPKYGIKSPTLVSNWPRPVPGDNDLLIQVKAVSINPIDWKIMEGATKLLLPLKPPFVIGNDGAGIVSGVGKLVKQFKPGDEVYFRPRKDRVGTFAEYCLIREDEAALRPGKSTWEEAAGLPLVALTAWQALFDKAGLKAGQRVLIHAGSGGVGTIAIQLAKNAGAHVITTCGPSGIELVKSLGADEIINYRDQKFDEILKDIDVVFDTMGGQTMKKSFALLKPGGVLVTVNGIPTPDVADRYGKGFILKTIFKIANNGNHSLARKAGGRFEYLLMEANGAQLEKIAKLVDSGIVKPIVDKVYPFSKMEEAFAYQMSGRAKGKVVLTI
ncbi:MAG: NADP-dependent oxidoreductase [Leptospirales bacterium]|nr:NADP-dependent oxidoreductase [Leptospirales bacterium]